MKLFIVLAWRNLWRNKRRTIIASASVFFALFLALIMRSLQYGSYYHMIDSSVRMYTGYIQVHAEGYWEERGLEKFIEVDDSLFKKIENIKGVTLVIPRIENYMLISSKEITKIASVFCISPEVEDSMTRLKKKLTVGNYLSGEDRGILIAEGLANMLGVNVGDSVVLYGQGLYGITVAINVPIIGIVKFALPDLNNSVVYMPLKFGQSIFEMQDKLTSISILISNPDELEKVQMEIKKSLPDGYEVMNWQEMMPELVQGIQLDSVFGLVMLLILYMIVAFGILGTVMMMTAERTKEFGILISVGMKKKWLMLVSLLESLFISLIGAFSGLVVAIPVIAYLKNHPLVFKGELAEISLKFGVEPIIPFSARPSIFLAHTFVVILIAMLCALYPIYYIRKLEPIKAMRL